MNRNKPDSTRWIALNSITLFQPQCPILRFPFVFFHTQSLSLPQAQSQQKFLFLVKFYIPRTFHPPKVRYSSHNIPLHLKETSTSHSPPELLTYVGFAEAKDNFVFLNKCSLQSQTDCFLIEIGRWIIWWIRKKEQLCIEWIVPLKGNCMGLNCKWWHQTLQQGPFSCTQAADLCRAAVSFAQTAFPSCEHILSQRSVQALVSYAKEMFE